MLPRNNGFNALVAVGDFVAIRTQSAGASTHFVTVFDSTTFQFTILRIALIQIATHKDNLAILTRESVILFDVEKNATITEISIPGTLPLGNLLPTDDFIFVLGTNGLARASAIFVVDLRHNTTTERRLAVPLEHVQMVVVGKYVVFTGTVTTQTQPVEIFDTVNLTWRFILLPRTLFTQSPLLIAIGNRAFIGRSLVVDALDVETGTSTTLPFSVSSLQRLVSYGTKLVTYSLDPASVTVYEVTTGDWTAMTFRRLGLPVEIISNYIMVYIGLSETANPFIMPLTAMLEGFDSEELFIGQTTNFTVKAVGPSLTYQWYHNGTVIGNDGSFLALQNVTMSSRGEYHVDIIDHCNVHIVHGAHLTVHSEPIFNVPLSDSVVLCDRAEELVIDAQGVAVEYKWSIWGSTIVNATQPHLNLSTADIACNTVALVCATAFNPSGQSQSCARVRMLELDRVVKGPLPTQRQPTWFSESKVTLSVNILEEDCARHTWMMDGVVQSEYEAQSSSLEVTLSPAMAKSEFYVRVKCGNSVIESRRYSFQQVSALAVYAVALIVVGLFVGVAGFVVIILLRKRLTQSQVKEVELATLLSNAKTDSLKKESMPIINKTTWQWTPTEEFSYKSLDALPVTIDASELKFSERKEPLEVEMNYNKELKFSSKVHKKSKKTTILTERLITDMKVDIYAPKSPKYEVTVEPETIYLEGGTTHSVTISVRMNMTTKCNVVLIVVLEQHKIYSAIEFKLESKISTWIDLEEIQMSGEFLGGGG